MIQARRNDGSNQYGDLHPGAYSDYTGYVPRNAPLPYCVPASTGCLPSTFADKDNWQPLVSNTGATQSFIAPHWERVRPFALSSPSQYDGTLRPEIQILQVLFWKGVNEALQYSAELTEQRKLIIEYWADGPASELPPGHWGLFAQFVSRRDNHSIDTDAKMFIAMHNASFDAGIVAWHFKRKFDGTRPITAVRFQKQGDTVVAWGGPGRPVEPISGARWIPYNPGSNLTPAFPGFISGHSTFSSASATVLRLFKGSDYFGYTTVVPPDFGRVEPGVPPIPTAISFATFSDAAIQAGLSRLYGGIHFSDDNSVGQNLGAQIGSQAYSRAQNYFQGRQP